MGDRADTADTVGRADTADTYLRHPAAGRGAAADMAVAAARVDTGADLDLASDTHTKVDRKVAGRIGKPVRKSRFGQFRWTNCCFGPSRRTHCRHPARNRRTSHRSDPTRKSFPLGPSRRRNCRHLGQNQRTSHRSDPTQKSFHLGQTRKSFHLGQNQRTSHRSGPTRNSFRFGLSRKTNCLHFAQNRKMSYHSAQNRKMSFRCEPSSKNRNERNLRIPTNPRSTTRDG